MNKIRHQGMDNFQSRCRAELEGQVVKTHYNRKTYQVGEINFGKNPESTFSKKTGEIISYRQYYLDRYQVKIQNLTQPLLVSRPSRQDLNRGDKEPIYLIPELCGMTGLTEEHRYLFTS